MAATPEQEQAARLITERVRRMVIEMLAAGEMGEVAIVFLSPYELKPVKRVHEDAPIVRVARGRVSAIERVR